MFFFLCRCSSTQDCEVTNHKALCVDGKSAFYNPSGNILLLCYTVTVPLSSCSIRISIWLSWIRIRILNSDPDLDPEAMKLTETKPLAFKSCFSFYIFFSCYGTYIKWFFDVNIQRLCDIQSLTRIRIDGSGSVLSGSGLCVYRFHWGFGILPSRLAGGCYILNSGISSTSH